MTRLFGRANAREFLEALLDGRTRRTVGAVFVTIAVAALQVPGSELGAAPDEASFTLEIASDDTITLDAEGAPLGAVLREIRDRTDVDIIMHADHLQLPVSARLQSLPVGKTIEILLKGLDYSCIFDDRGDLERVVTFPAGVPAEARLFVPTSPRDAAAVATPIAEDHPAGPATGLVLPPEDTDLTGVMQVTPPPETEP